MDFVESDTKCLGEFQLREKVNSHKKFERKTEKVFLKTDPLFAKHAFFATGVSRQQVARASRQKTQSQNYEKNFYVFFATGRSTREGVAS